MTINNSIEPEFCSRSFGNYFIAMHIPFFRAWVLWDTTLILDKIVFFPFSFLSVLANSFHFVCLLIISPQIQSTKFTTVGNYVPNVFDKRRPLCLLEKWSTISDWTSFVTCLPVHMNCPPFVVIYRHVEQNAGKTRLGKSSSHNLLILMHILVFLSAKNAPSWSGIGSGWGAFNLTQLGAAAYQLGNTSSRTITEIKQRWARLVLGWETVQV